MTPAAGQPYSIGLGELKLSIPAGADTYDAPNVRAMLSALIGVLDADSAGIGQVTIDGTL
jgi:hypothetical protein